MKNNHGFGLIETLVVITIVGVVMVIAVSFKPVTFKKAAMKEGMQLMEQIDVQTKLYRAKNGTIPSVSKTGSSPVINVTALQNKYFKEFALSYASGNNFTVSVYGSDLANGVTLRAVINSTTSNKQNLSQGQVEIYGL
ncbi:MAG: type II secretion system protein [Endomicrobiaceae bacterium]|jgi:prepilin-type N-terminal cleavage/methylation domain-containing protein|nr:type II secretion system protein [Endomicrobiaceae bacterium]